MKYAAEFQAAVMPHLAKIDALSRRERMLVLITMLAMIAAVWHVMFMEPLRRQADASRIEMSALRDSVEAANQNLEDQILQLAGTGSGERTRIAVLHQRIDEINATLGNYAAELIDPAEMARVLEEVLKEQSSLSLVHMRNTTPELLSTGEEANATAFYRHGLEIEVEGDFAACLEYLTEIEALPWRLYWQVLELEVIEYPQNRVRLKVSTLSLEEEWIGA
jgi:MSHA biogenesis protein MshJ